MQLEDEAAGGGMQNNLALELQRQEAAQQEEKKRRALAAGEVGKAEGDAKPAASQATQEDAPGDVCVVCAGSLRVLSLHVLSLLPRPCLLCDIHCVPCVQELQRAFARAAALVKEKQQEDAMSDAEKVIKYVKRWTKEWEAEVEGMAPEVLATGAGAMGTRTWHHTCTDDALPALFYFQLHRSGMLVVHVAHMQSAGRQTKLSFQQTKMAFDSMYRQLRNGTLDKSLTSGLWRLLSAMQERDYLKASEIYMQLAIGNAPWPIGVTSVGIHERSAREKISHVMNTDSTAHIMTDEATRRSLQGIKRLMTFVQRTYPSDPSKSMEYNAFKHTAPAALANLPQIEYKPS